MSSRKYNVPFATAVEALPRFDGPRRFTITTADRVDPDDLFALDTQLRHDYRTGVMAIDLLAATLTSASTRHQSGRR